MRNFVKRHRILYNIIFSLWGYVYMLMVRFIFRNIKDAKHGLRGTKPKVIIFGLRTIPTSNLAYFDAIFAYAFRKLGCQVKMLYCDGALDSCDADTVFRDQKSQCFLCRKLGPSLKRSLGLDCLSYRDYISDTDKKEIANIVEGLRKDELFSYVYKGINVGNHAKLSGIRYFLCGRLDVDDPTQEALLRKKLFYGMVTAKVAEELYRQEKPDIVFMLHGEYSSWGPFMDYCRSKQIDVTVYAREAYRFSSFIFSRNGKEYELTAKQAWEEFKQIPLSKAENAQVEEYISARFKGTTRDHLMYKKNINKRWASFLETRLFHGAYKRRYVVYSSILWDSPVQDGQSLLFRDSFEWIDATINYFIDKPEFQLIIKPHPGERIWEKGTRTIYSYILDTYPDLPDNIVVLDSDMPLGAHDLITSDTLCLTFTGTLGLEFATEGIPVLVVGKVHYKEAGVVYKVNTIEEYLRLLDDFQEVRRFSKNNKDLARKYAYFYFFRRMIEIPFYSKSQWAEMDWRVIADTKKLFGDDSNIMKICKKIISGHDILMPL
ncbi:MAG: hypothetical protein JW734_08945 [Candidatus Omnitrophica bacterium]|nr:hypothetical protein [Candidatus Omnitrophota bacterium]